jgi:hypothetical protein
MHAKGVSFVRKFMDLLLDDAPSIGRRGRGGEGVRVAMRT